MHNLYIYVFYVKNRVDIHIVWALIRISTQTQIYMRYAAYEMLVETVNEIGQWAQRQQQLKRKRKKNKFDANEYKLTFDVRFNLRVN